jgi:ferrous iron transport protein A
MRISLVEMKHGEKGTVVDIQGGWDMTSRVQGMGIRIGKKIKKTGSHFWRGPQTVMVDNFQVAIGHGMASRIFVEVNR